MERRKICIWVTAKNQEWAADILGMPLSEIERLYKEAHDDERVCSIEGRVSFTYRESRWNQKDKGYHPAVMI